MAQMEAYIGPLFENGVTFVIDFQKVVCEQASVKEMRIEKVPTQSWLGCKCPRGIYISAFFNLNKKI